MSASAYLDAVRKRCEAATAGPWEVNDDRVARPYPFFTFCVALTDDNGVRYYVRSKPEVGSAADDFAFIAEARTDLPKLERIARLAEDLREAYSRPLVTGNERFDAQDALFDALKELK